MTDEKKKHLFKPGQSGNPSGRAKGPELEKETGYD